MATSTGSSIPTVAALPFAYDSQVTRMDDPDSNITSIKNITDSGCEALVSQIPNIKAGPVEFGTQGKYFWKNNNLRETNPTLIAGKKAFDQMLALVQRAHKDTVTLTIDCDRCLATMTSKSGKVEIKTIGQLKNEIAQATGRTVLDVQAEIEDCFLKFDSVFMRMGIKTLAHYSPVGEDTLASSWGGKALAIERDTHPLIKNQQDDNLEYAAKNEHGILSLIGHSHATDQEKKDAVDKALQAEAFFIHFRDNLTKLIDDLTKVNVGGQHTVSIDHYTKLRDQLLETNRHALWAAAIYDDPNVCFDNILHDYYEVAYAGADAKQKPSFQKFRESGDAVPFVMRAAEIASLMIIDPAEYRIFCTEKGIAPRDHHPNRLLNQVLNRPGDPVPYELLGHTFTAPEADEINALIADARKVANDLIPEVNKVARKEKTAQARLKTATAAKSLHSVLRDNKTWESSWKRGAMWLKRKVWD